MGSVFRRPKAPPPMPVHIPEAPVVQAQFNPADEDESTSSKRARRKGKSALIVPRKSGKSGIKKDSSGGAGLQVGAK